MREDCKVLCFCEDTPNGRFGYELSRMWALYGDNHKGVCLELDKEVFIEENNLDAKFFKIIQYVEPSIPDFKNYKRIDYNEMNNLGKGKYLRKIFRPLALDYLYFTKDKEWESENEIRLIHFSDNINYEFRSIKKSIRNIFLGVDFQEGGLNEVINACQIADISKLKYEASRLKPLMPPFTTQRGEDGT